MKQRARGNINSELDFSFGPGMKTPKDIFDLPKLNDFKKELLEFFINEYHIDKYAVTLSNKVLYCSVDNEYKMFLTINGLIKVENVPELYRDYLEADTRVTFHEKHADEANPGIIVIFANDADIMIILLANTKKFNSHIWYDCGLVSFNTRCYVNTRNFAKTIN